MIPPYVSCVTNRIFVSEVADETMSILKAMGAYQEAEYPKPKTWFIDYTDERDEAKKLSQLRDFGIVFGYSAAGWPPGAIFEEFRDKGLISGTYKRIYWRGPDEFIVEEA
jgi:hypothetical protein